MYLLFFFQAEDGIRDVAVTGVQTCALPISAKKLKNTAVPARLLVFAVDGRLDAGDLRFARPGRLATLPFADLAKPGEKVRLQRAELRLADLAQLEPHLGREQLLAQPRVVVQLGIDRRGDLAEHELDAAHEQAVDDDHFPSFALSSLRRMLTKLYGGQGPVYLKVSLSCSAPICFTRWSNACSLSRETRNAAFMIILSPIGLLAREATAT